MRDGPYFKWNIITQNRISEILPLLAHLSNANSKSPLTTYRREQFCQLHLDKIIPKGL